MKKRFGVGIILLVGLVLGLFVLAARLPVNGQDSNSWGTLMNEYLGVIHDSGGNLKGSVVGSSQISDVGIQAIDINQSVVNTTHIVDATIGAIDIASDTINATHLTEVSRLLFGACNVDLPQLTVANGGVNNTANAGNPTFANCTVSGAAAGDRVIVTPNSHLPANVSLNSANITVGNNITLGFTYAGHSFASTDAGSFSFSYIVFINSTG